ncbi:response regulator transcription factor [Paenibacillus arenilitoris]|uniref:Response regulator n=1 Tax=Paenibacillus arenilitoris TaxID=2772299 RepID=A0A927CG53_9BACL|nr:response regulator [Paenibacillus arenilitoris]MBD2866940.1 response regulator [Paenibacillus arenilitoris]
MYRLLIVDDERIIASGIKKSVDWGRLGIVGVAVAHNMRQAIAVFEKQPVDIMICDIEMPQGDGFELFAWVRERYPHSECIFLTCHAEFKYAQRAIQLGSLEYLLKPVRNEELAAIVARAVEKIGKKRETLSVADAYAHYQRLWETHRPLLVERFWLDVLEQTIPPRAIEAAEAIRKRGIAYEPDSLFVPVLVTVQHWRRSFTAREEKLLRYAIRNALEEPLGRRYADACVVQVREGLLLVSPPRGRTEDANHCRSEFRSELESFIEAGSRYFYCSLSCYVGDPVPIHGMTDMYGALAAIHRDNVNMLEQVIFLDEYAKRSCLNRDCRFPSLPMLLWSELLKRGDKERLFAETKSFLEGCSRNEAMNAKALQQWYQQFLQMMLSTFQQLGLQADEMLLDHLDPVRTSEATRTVHVFGEWMEEVLDRAIARIRGGEAEGVSIVERIKKYIAANIDQELSRTYIADHVGLSPDYAVKLFKKETGVSVSDYIVQARLQLAKTMLEKTDMPIGSIALAVGYSNFAYFSTLFKRETNMTPQDYRRNRNDAV